MSLFASPTFLRARLLLAAALVLAAMPIASALAPYQLVSSDVQQASTYLGAMQLVFQGSLAALALLGVVLVGRRRGLGVRGGVGYQGAVRLGLGLLGAYCFYKGLVWAWAGEAAPPRQTTGAVIADAAHHADAHPLGLLFVGLGVIVLAPLVEEVLYRGVLLGALVQWMPKALAIVVSAAAFAYAHHGSTPTELLWLIGALGLLLGHFRLRTDSLVPGVFLHAANNALVFSNWAGAGTPGLGQTIGVCVIALVVGATALHFLSSRARDGDGVTVDDYGVEADRVAPLVVLAPPAPARTAARPPVPAPATAAAA